MTKDEYNKLYEALKLIWDDDSTFHEGCNIINNLLVNQRRKWQRKKVNFKPKEYNIEAIQAGIRKYRGYSQKDLEELVNKPRQHRKEGSYISR